MSKKMTFERGNPEPLGISRAPEGINFALFSEEASEVTLCLFRPHEIKSFADISLKADLHKTGNVWHLLIKNLPEQVEYGYKIQKNAHVSKLLLDPYAKSLNLSPRWHTKWKSVRGRVLIDLPFNWEGDVHPHIPMKDLIIYEMHVRAVTMHSSSRVQHPGTYLAVIEKIPHFLELGINAIELMPIHVFDETDNKYLNPLTHHSLCNFWGYAPLNYFALMNRYASKSKWGEEIQEFKEMVKALHRAGIEVILDVVFNHTGEADKKITSFRGIDEKTYYIYDSKGRPLDFSGCGNTFNCNHPIVSALIVESLRYCVRELHVDGFRFDLASTFCRDKDQVLEDPPIIRAITQDSLLAQTKLIAEAWDAAGLYQVGTFPGGSKWAQWNGRYRDTARRFIKGSDGESGAFATALSGSQNLFGKGSPNQSINFITSHDGFTLFDLVSYQKKHNEGNGEDNRDGLSENDSWNCGSEGPTHDKTIIALRERQMRNFLLALFVSIGTPMLLMGDEYGHTRKGNNNTYSQDNELNYFLWDQLIAEKEFVRFTRLMISWRKQLPHFNRSTFFTPSDIIWHGHSIAKPDWGPKSRFVAYQIKDPSADLYIAFNAHFQSASVQIPVGKWQLLVNTSLDSPYDIFENAMSAPLVETTLHLIPHSATMLLLPHRK